MALQAQYVGDYRGEMLWVCEGHIERVSLKQTYRGRRAVEDIDGFELNCKLLNV